MDDKDFRDMLQGAFDEHEETLRRLAERSRKERRRTIKLSQEQIYDVQWNAFEAGHLQSDGRFHDDYEWYDDDRLSCGCCECCGCSCWMDDEDGTYFYDDEEDDDEESE